ncbi:MAG: hypothetical protein E6897_11815 [Cutibacterium avidum]|nr:hypothetical protein [Cutibacterium avidum]MDU5415362.1 hypothetical protein [Cutibacterium avidum]MDU5419258.1 hypothetical protein [Cutibacterium avidum]MDU5547717.1 hypothetical protein [Cutibacterium avidum]
MARPKRPSPSAFSADWPDVACDDAAAEKVRLLALAVRDALGTKSIRSTAAGVGLDHSVVGDLMAGRSWPDARTVALLEVALDVSLWPPHEPTE